MFSWIARVSGGRRLGTLLVVAAFLLGIAAAPATAQSDKRVVKVMTYNMDAGTDFLYFFALPNDPVTAAQLTYQELLNTDFRGRAGLIADQIAAAKPDLVSVQEATLWETLGSKGKRVVLADELDLLREALRGRHEEYRVVGIQELSDLAAPLGDGSYVRFLDRNVILARLGPGTPELVSNVRMGVYAAHRDPIPGFPEINGWMSVDVKAGDTKCRFFATHLTSPISETDATQVFQGLELIQLLNASPLPVVLAGDFNSDATGGAGGGVDQTPTAGLIFQAGYAEVWHVLRPNEDGFTWPLFFEDLFPGRDFFSGPERIDLVFVKGVVPLSIDLVGSTSPFPSDHAGVVATLLIEK